MSRTENCFEDIPGLSRLTHPDLPTSTALSINSGRANCESGLGATLSSEDDIENSFEENREVDC